MNDTETGNNLDIVLNGHPPITTDQLSPADWASILRKVLEICQPEVGHLANGWTIKQRGDKYVRSDHFRATAPEILSLGEGLTPETRLFCLAVLTKEYDHSTSPTRLTEKGLYLSEAGLVFWEAVYEVKIGFQRWDGSGPGRRHGGVETKTDVATYSSVRGLDDGGALEELLGLYPKAGKEALRNIVEILGKTYEKERMQLDRFQVCRRKVVEVAKRIT